MTRQPMRTSIYVNPSPETGDPSWLITLADLAGLLLVFFVMMFAMSEIDRQELRRVATAAIVETGAQSSAETISVPIPQSDETMGRDPGYLTTVIRAKFEGDPILSDLSVTDQGDRAIVFVPARQLKDLGGGEPAQLTLSLAGVLRLLPNAVEVESRLSGARARQDPDRWRLALLVGQRMARALQQAGVPGPIAVRSRVDAPSGQAGLDIVIFATARPDSESAER